MIAVGTNPGNLFLSGTGGVWRSDKVAAGAKWQPTSLGLGLTIMRAEATGLSGDLYIGDQDHAFIGFDPSTEQVKSATHDSPPQAVGGFAVAADPVISPDRVYLGVSDPDCAVPNDPDHPNNCPHEGDIGASLYWKDDPMHSDPGGWSALALPAGSGDPYPHRPVGVAAGRGTAECSAGQPMDLIAAVARNGLWRYQGCGEDTPANWTKESPPEDLNFICGVRTDVNQSDIKIPVVWPQPGANPTYAYVLDRCTQQVYRIDLPTNDASIPITIEDLDTNKTTGFMAAKPDAPNILWVTGDGLQGNVYRIKNADTTPNVAPYTLSGVGHWDGNHDVAGPIAVTAGNHAYVAAVDTDPPDPGQTRASVGIYEIVDGLPSWVGDLTLPGATVQAQDLAVSCPHVNQPGHLYVATQGDGVIDVTISSC